MDKVYGAILSPFVRKVLMTLEYKQHAPDIVMEVPPVMMSDTFKRISPLQKMPAYEDEQVAIADSSVICDYLDHKYPAPSIYPKAPASRARALWLEELADTRLQEYLGPGIFFEAVVTPQRFKRPPDQQKIRDSVDALRPYQDYLEQQISADEFLIDNQLSIADLIVPGVFLNANYGGYTVDAKRWPKLSNYLQTLWRHPLYVFRQEQERVMLDALRKSAS